MVQTIEELLTLPECEAISKKKVSTWRRYILERKVKYCKLGRSVRIPRSELERLIREGMREPVK